MPARKKTSSQKGFTANLGFEAKLWIPSERPCRACRYVQSLGQHSFAETPADYVFAYPPVNDSDTSVRGCAFLQSKRNPQVVSEVRDIFRNNNKMHWQSNGAKWKTRQGCPDGERGGVHQFGVPPEGNANFAGATTADTKYRRDIGQN